MAFVVVVGQDYVGLPVPMRAVEVGHRVVGLDIDENRVARLVRVDSYVEDVSDEQIAAALASSRYVPTTALDAVMVLTDHDIFDWDLVVHHGRYVSDTRCRVSGKHVERL